MKVGQFIENLESVLKVAPPYAHSGGSTNLKAIIAGAAVDCSGLLKACSGGAIPNGSNTIWRKNLSDKGSISNHGSTNGYPKNVNARKSTQLEIGMAVFKWNATDTSKYPDGLGDYQHIGVVASVNPLRIIHSSSTTECVTCDTKIGKWCAWGYLKDIDYGEEVTEMDEFVDYDEEEEATLPFFAKVDTRSGNLNVRNEANGKKVITQFVKGEIVKVSALVNDWAYCSDGIVEGWCKYDFLSYYGACEDEPDDVGVEEEEDELSVEEKIERLEDKIDYLIKLAYMNGEISRKNPPPYTTFTALEVLYGSVD